MQNLNDNILYKTHQHKIINYIYILSPEQREKLTSLDSFEEKKSENKETIEEAIQKEKNVLLQMQGIKEVILLDDDDRKYIFENEEDRNHGVFETIRKKIVFCFTHNSTFKDAQEPIVLKLGEKIIFPAVSFSEIKRNSVVSSFPSLKVHNYLSPKFQNVDEYDATVLVGFDL